MNNDTKEVKLSYKENIMLKTIECVLAGNTTKQEAANILGVSLKTIYRAIDVYLYDGANGFAHKLRGIKPSNALSEKIWNDVIYLYKNIYSGFNFSHFNEKLSEEHQIFLAYGTVHNILSSANITSPKAQKKRKKKYHPIRERRKTFGELVQLDASNHLWFGKKKAHLHLAIDDATSRILGGFFDFQEPLFGYYKLFEQVLKEYGVPKELYTDRRTVFIYQKKGRF